MGSIGPNPHSVRACVNGVRIGVSPAVVRVKKESRLASRWIGRHFGRTIQKSLAAILHFLGAPIQTLIAAKGGPNWTKSPLSLSPSLSHPLSLSLDVCVNGARNAVFVAAIRFATESRLASRRNGRNFGRIAQK